ncbi:hypothetical protein GCM10009104_11700 [Marinobacterium maritimum]|uniref:Exonuclease domain-containing protein n=1 Tax=Marinobacterium maritimum TaxID=500162 RepID=A0ABN1I447_9GAMM
MICIDLEASGLAHESYPIEIAWKCTDTGDSDSFLINPDSVPEWQYWDEFAEELHGIEPELLQQEGISADQACLRLNRALKGREVISDAFEYDGFWLRRLFEACGMQPSFHLVGLEAVLSAEERIQYQFIARSQFRRHRALQDVEDLISAITAARSGVVN